MDKQMRGHIVILLVAGLCLSGCHSALLQTAKTRDGLSVTAGAVRTYAGHDADVSEYTVFLKGEIGRAAHRHRSGYSLGLTVITPLSNGYRDAFSDPGVEYGTFPNEWTALYPELKLQAPRVLPVDLALDVRMMAYMPERLAAIASYDISPHVTLYGGYTYLNSAGTVSSGGAELSLSPSLSVFAEYTGWLTDHDYPDAYEGPSRRRPYTIGIALSYHLPLPTAPPDPRTTKRGQTVRVTARLEERLQSP
jgi:hypothetical protein